MSHPGACGNARALHVYLHMSMVALVVDDSMLIRYTVCRFLEQRGFEVESATNGVEALEILARIQPAVIVTDLQMPKMSGNELITAIKSNLKTTGVPIIVLARRASGLNGASGLDHVETRANFFIYKDIDIEAQLAKTLDELFGQASRGHGAGN
jgi:CheY-like chemotaxis protein